MRMSADCDKMRKKGRIEKVKNRCFIVGAGDYSDLWIPGKDDFVIAADAGYSHLALRGIIPELIVGDFDSLSVLPEHDRILRSPTQKDYTDMALAVKEGLALGYTSFLLDGGLGGRLDHSFANIQLLANISQYGTGILLGRDFCVTAVKNGCVNFSSCESGYISVFSADEEARGVSIKGLRYPLRDAVLKNDFSLGVSNEFVGKPATVCVSEGTLIIMWEVFGKLTTS